MISRDGLPSSRVEAGALDLPLPKDYVNVQSAFIREWITAVAVGISKGWTKEECVKRISFLDRFPVDIGQEYMGPRVQEMNVSALFDYLTKK